MISSLCRPLLRMFWLSSLALFTGMPTLGQDGYVTQRVLPVVEMLDVGFIQQLLDEQFILPEDPDFTHALFYDITRDGFGSNDVMVLYPSEEQFQLGAYLSGQMADALSTQGLSTDYNLVTIREYADLLSEEAENESDPKKALASSMIQTIQSYYSDGDFQGYISRQGEDVRITFWGFDEAMWRFLPGVSQCIEPPESEPVMLVAHKQPEIRTFLDIDGCVIVESSTTSAQISSRVCE
ncbi:MAG: hypothetical protein OXI05_10075 [Bacteroidota bacterium]|nr:hypothetical protein [Bacteroidota bacterium]MXW31711.1 hypothetical protein [Rhodothermaceae bacterium]MDE2646165.1 hypothetical protein [Bacteroidota bacterium]MXZ57283.1 hypothetical protein [Rhodothermaceae bacterium]MYC03456.1 hypothetical protein [Rhodothermaceae bacterium]